MNLTSDYSVQVAAVGKSDQPKNVDAIPAQTILSNADPANSANLSSLKVAELAPSFRPVSPNSEPSEAAAWVTALVDCPAAEDVYTYRIPDGLIIQPGDVLSVPFGAQQVGAIALQLQSHLPSHLEPDQIRPVEDVISEGFCAPSYWLLLQKVAQYYQTPLIQVVRTALPPKLLGRSQARVRLIKTDIADGEKALLLPAAQQILTLLQKSKTSDYTRVYLQRKVKQFQRGLRQLQQTGWVESYLEPPESPQPKLQQAVTVTTDPNDLDADTITKRQREILQILWRNGGDCWLTDALQLCQTSSTTLKKLEQKGHISIQDRERLRMEPDFVPAADQAKALTPAQAEALNQIHAADGSTTLLLHGVTGSGKTEVYLQAIAPLLKAGKSVLVLVPEIGLTPQLTDRFRARYGRSVCVYHSALSDGERYDTWRQLLQGDPCIVIGTRSAVFAPLQNVGLIVLDEEHDSSFKQDQPAPCYHARTVAQWRAELENCPLLLGSATPSLETWQQAVEIPPAPLEKGGNRAVKDQQVSVADEEIPPLKKGGAEGGGILHPSTSHQPRHIYLSLPQRIHDRPMPQIQVVDLRTEFREGNRSILSRPLQLGLGEMKAKGQQGLLFIHRRGHSSFVSCRSCGYVMPCPDCDVSLSYHRPYDHSPPILRCHYCNYARSQPPACPECGSQYLKNFGSGTQRVVQSIHEQFPDLSCIRFDSDTTRAKGAHRALLTRFAQGEADLLVGTQMLTKGIDLPQVTLVGILAADGLLYMSDYRASERTFQTLLQVAGRAGRGDDPGRVILQTYNPQHPVIEAVQKQNYAAFAEAELQQRQETHFPPYCQVVLLRFSSLDPVQAQQTAEQMADLLDAPDSILAQVDHQLLGPAPAPILRIARRYRWQLLLKFPLGTDVPDLNELRTHCPRQVRLAIDVDPLHFG